MQKPTFCTYINYCIYICLIFLSAIWFIFVIIINNRVIDPRINALNLMSPISETFQDGLYLRKINVIPRNSQDNLMIGAQEWSKLNNKDNIIKINNNNKETKTSKNNIINIIDNINDQASHYSWIQQQQEILLSHNNNNINSHNQENDIFLSSNKYHQSKNNQIHQSHSQTRQRKHSIKSSLNIFQLIQIMNDQSPNIIGQEAIIIISITNQQMQLSGLKFAQYLFKNKENNEGNKERQNMNNKNDIKKNSKENQNIQNEVDNDDNINFNFNVNENNYKQSTIKRNNYNNKQQNNNERSQQQSFSSSSSFQSSSQPQPPIYIIRQTQPIILSNQKYLLSYRRQISQILHYFTFILNIKKLSLLSYDVGALLTLYTLSLQQSPQIFTSLSKVVLINPFNIDIKIFHSPPMMFVQNYIKKNIIESEEKLEMFNKLRLIIISTKRTIFVENQGAQRYFTFSYSKKKKGVKDEVKNGFIWDSVKNKDKDNTNKNAQSSSIFSSSQSSSFQPSPSLLYRFANTHTISTRSMWNVFCFFDKPIYFFYQPFIYLLSKFFQLDSKNQMSYNEIQYFFHYKQDDQVNTLSEKLKRKYINSNKCYDFALQTYSYNGNIFTQECLRLLRKQLVYFQYSSILLYSKQKFEVYGENFQRIYPLESKTTYMVYHIEKMNQFRRIFVINRKAATIHMKISEIFTPLHNPIIAFQFKSNYNSQNEYLDASYQQKQKVIFPTGISNLDYSQVSFQNLTNFQIVRTCEPSNLIFPLHFAKMARFGHGIIFNPQPNQNCYTQYDNYDFYPDWFMLNWNILRNMMIFTLFCSHILGKELNERFFTQNFVNEILIFTSTGNFFMFQGFITLATLCVGQMGVKYLVKLTQRLVLLKRVLLNFLWLPIVIQILSLYIQPLPSSWKILFLLLGLTISQHNFQIILIKLFFLFDYIKYDRQNIKGILIVSLWAFITGRKIDYGQAEGNNGIFLKKKVIDLLFLVSMAVCVNEQGSVLDQIVNSYIVMNTLLFLNRYF